MTYDRMDWNSLGRFPRQLPPENAGTHIGMFLAWAIQRGLQSQTHTDESAQALAKVRRRRMTGRTFLIEHCDEKLWESDLNAEGNAFTQSYYESERYFKDYKQLFKGKLPSIYHVADSWTNFDRLCKLLDRQFALWKKQQTQPVAAPRPGKTLLRGPGLDRGTGQIRFHDSPELIGPALTRTLFLKSPLAGNASISVRNEPWCSWKLGRTLEAGLTLGVLLQYHAENLVAVTLWQQDANARSSWDDWSSQKEMASKTAHDKWLTRMLGKNRKFSWGSAESSYDERGGSASIYIKYK